MVKTTKTVKTSIFIECESNFYFLKHKFCFQFQKRHTVTEKFNRLSQRAFYGQFYVNFLWTIFVSLFFTSDFLWSIFVLPRKCFFATDTFFSSFLLFFLLLNLAFIIYGLLKAKNVSSIQVDVHFQLLVLIFAFLCSNLRRPIFCQNFILGFF